MVHRNDDEGHQEPKQRGRPRGRPFKKGHTINTKSKNEVLDDSGREISDSRGDIAPNTKHAIVEPKKQEIEPLENAKNVSLTGTTVSPSAESPKDESKEENQIVDKIEFTNGENKLTIRFSKKHNRMFRIQVFLNDESEIRPVTYTGASTGYAFWNLLKGALKK